MANVNSASSKSIGQATSVRAPQLWVIPLLLLVAVVWSYWPTLRPLIRDWQADENYSVGQLVPLAALYLLWNDRKALAKTPLQPSWWGVVLILLAQLPRFYGIMFLFESAERYSVVVTIWGLILLVGGVPLWRRTIWVQMFLLLMVPLPGRIHNMISGPLQGLATSLAVYALELMGITVMQEGHTMVLNGNVHVAVAEACSGLRMLTAFVVVTAVLAYVMKRPPWQKAVLLFSSVPVAIACNLVRLVVTSLLFMFTSSTFAERFFHDFAGLTMMPLAVLLLLAELQIMARLVTEDAK